MQNEYIVHYGTKGQKWYKRLYQNPDGSLTPLGRLRYGKWDGKKKTGQNSVSKNQNGKSENTAAKTTAVNNDNAEKVNYSAKARAKNIDEMSDQELNSYINRLRLEQSYAQMMKQPEEKKKVNAGAQFIKDVAYNAGKQVATDLAKQGMNYLGATTLNKAIGKNIFNVKVQDDDKKKGNN